MYTKIMRYLLSHIVLILIVVALVLVFYYRDFLFTDRVNASIDDTVSGLAFWRAQKSPSEAESQAAAVAQAGEKQKASQTSSQQLAQASSSATYSSKSVHKSEDNAPGDQKDSSRATAANDSVSADSPGEVAVADNQEETEPTEAPAKDEAAAVTKTRNGTPQTDDSGEQEQAADEAHDPSTAATQSAGGDSPEKSAGTADMDRAEPGEAEQAEAGEDAQQLVQLDSDQSELAASVTSTDAETETAQQAAASPSEADPGSESAAERTNRLIRMARNAFQQGNMQEAEKYYQQFIDNDPQDPNAYGELGNVYYEQGKWEQAGEAYYEAAVRLLAIGETSQVEYLLRIIQGLHPQSAEKLQKKMAGQ